MRTRALLFCLLLTGCTSQAVQPPDEASVEPSLDDEIETLLHDELTWRLPNSLAQTYSDDGRSMRLTLARARVLTGTQDLAQRLSEDESASLLRELAATDDEFRAIVLARLLVASGMQQREVQAAIGVAPLDLDWDGWGDVLREGAALHELG